MSRLTLKRDFIYPEAIKTYRVVFELITPLEEYQIRAIKEALAYERSKTDPDGTAHPYAGMIATVLGKIEAMAAINGVDFWSVQGQTKFSLEEIPVLLEGVGLNSPIEWICDTPLEFDLEREAMEYKA